MVDDQAWMARAIQLARRGEGLVEPNPMVGCVIVRDGQLLAEGWHRSYGGPHAEVEAIEAAGDSVESATAYVTLEPCSHHGKTPPCSDALARAGIRRVVVGCRDPNPLVDGGGMDSLRAAGVEVVLLQDNVSAAELIAPFRKLITQSRPWVIAKWAMTLDGRIATATGDSQWISNELSRRVVHEIRGRVDAILVGRRTVELDDPLLTARPPGKRIPARVVIDPHARVAPDCRLLSTIDQAPVIVFTGSQAPEDRITQLRHAGAEVIQHTEDDSKDFVELTLDELGRRNMTNVMVEGGGTLLGSLHDHDQIDEWHVFIAPTIAGGSHAVSPIEGKGRDLMKDTSRLISWHTESLGDNLYVRGRTQPPSA